MKPNIKLVISIVSHGQGDLVKILLNDLNKLDFSEFESVKIVLTLNIPEDEEFMDGYDNLGISIIRNINQKGFGMNHNCAFEKEENDLFVIINPDIRLNSFSFSNLASFINDTVGAVGPRVLSPTGNTEDNFRKYPTILRILKRTLLGKRTPDYKMPSDNSTINIDWLAGMFVAFNSTHYKSIGGFDEKFYMYLEDADICRRLCNRGFKILYIPSLCVIHDARRSTFKNSQHFKWHIRSMTRFILHI
jgi:GT2 family glycosyltransferase